MTAMKVFGNPAFASTNEWRTADNTKEVLADDLAQEHCAGVSENSGLAHPSHRTDGDASARLDHASPNESKCGLVAKTEPE